MNLPWLGKEVEGWHPDVRDAKRRELQEAEERWREPVRNAWDALVAYGKAD